MTSLQVLGFCAAVAIAFGVLLAVTIHAPLRALLRRVCSGEEAVAFWHRFALVMLLLSPLFTGLVFGVPRNTDLHPVEFGHLLRSAASSALTGAFLAMLGMGLWISSLIRRAPHVAAGPVGSPRAPRFET